MDLDKPTLKVITAAGAELLFFEKGILPLWQLFHDSPGVLRGAFVDDRVTGLGAAVLMVAAGVGRYHSGVMSLPAKEYCEGHRLQGEADIIVPEIINRAGTGRCPLESRLTQCGERSYLAEIEAFVSELKE